MLQTWPSSPAASHLRRGRAQARERHSGPSGKARKIVVTKDETTVVEGAGTESDIKGRISQIKTEIENTTRTMTGRSCRSVWPSWPVAWPSSRSARPPRSTEGEEAPHRGCRVHHQAAVEEGVVPGGGVPFSGLRPPSWTGPRSSKRRGDRSTDRGSAVEEPLKQISVNAGLEGGVVVERVRNCGQ